eukprot:TRINITY_DN44168_c0_g1_i2.p1 TRINITY_DN44168_c0_g1~~TRINITY_DN44168_c0_g1_i2.p1  ORF type:complete len:641 (-),score=169.95 TRINITY_DN44168_c0_g1_i2:177-2099(-)
MIRRPPRSTLSSSSAASDVYKRQVSTQSTGKLRKSMAEAEGQVQEKLLERPPEWAATATWIGGTFCVTLADCSSAAEVQVIPRGESVLELRVREESWRMELPYPVSDSSQIGVTFDKHLRELKISCGNDRSSEEAEAAIEGLKLRAEEQAALDRSWCDRAAMFGAGYEVVPMRLSDDERSTLKVVEGALEVSEYTDVVDCYHNMSLQASGYRGFGMYSGLGYGGRGANSTKASKIRDCVADALATCSGLELASNYKRGKRLVGDKQFKDNAEFFSHAFELARRFKVTNPGKMRSTYGKMMYLLQDSRAEDPLGFDMVSPILTVRSFLEDKGATDMIQDPDLEVATTPVSCYDPDQIREAAEIKEAAKARLMATYASSVLSSEEVERCIHSIGDGMGYAAANTRPVAKMIQMLKEYFSSKEGKYSLAIRNGRGGSCLSHDHSTQYTFVLQSLTLWREIMSKLYRCWLAADADLLSARHSYRLVNTGQGLNRVQPASNVSQLMQSILSKVQREAGGWVGLSVVHLGDRDVPNALWFIDKYNQVPRILGPLANVLEQIEDLAKDPGILRYLQRTFGGVNETRTVILQDFFRHAFDGSGDDGGSCIDGRLTSAWNWCSNLSKKKYYNVFLLAGFKSFDGDFSTS